MTQNTSSSLGRLEKAVEQLTGIPAEVLRAMPLAQVRAKLAPKGQTARGIISSEEVNRQLDQALRSI